VTLGESAAYITDELVAADVWLAAAQSDSRTGTS